jgi:hypothetical protein
MTMFWGVFVFETSCVFAQVQGFLFESFFFFGVKKPPGVPGVCFCGSV